MQKEKQKFLNSIGDFVFLKEEQSCDEYCDIFGGYSMIPNRVKEAERLYKSGYIYKILATGGIGHLSRERLTPEAFKMKDYLVEQGIPKKDILVELNSRNTYENIKFSLELIKKKYNTTNAKLVLITSDFHMKRCKGIIEKELGTFNVLGQEVKNDLTDAENWQNTLMGRRIIYQEALLLYYSIKQQKMNDFSLERTEKKSK